MHKILIKRKLTIPGPVLQMPINKMLNQLTEGNIIPIFAIDIKMNNKKTQRLI